MLSQEEARAAPHPPPPPPHRAHTHTFNSKSIWRLKKRPQDRTQAERKQTSNIKDGGRGREITQQRQRAEKAGENGGTEVRGVF